MKQRKCLSMDEILFVQAIITMVPDGLTVTGSMIVKKSEEATKQFLLSKPIRLRDIPEIVHYLRTVKRLPICNIGKGYFRSYSVDDITQTEKYIKSKFKSLHKTIKALSRIRAKIVTKEITET